MSIEQAKTQLSSFLKGRELTFTVKNFPSGEWVAECNEIPGIITGGMGNDITGMDSLIRDAILTAAGLNPENSKELLNFIGFKTPGFLGCLFGLNKEVAYGLPQR